MDDFKLHDAARVRYGRYSGAVGTVTDTRTENGKQTAVRVKVEGVKDDQPYTAHVWLKRTQVGRNHG